MQAVRQTPWNASPHLICYRETRQMWSQASFGLCPLPQLFKTQTRILVHASCGQFAMWVWSPEQWASSTALLTFFLNGVNSHPEPGQLKLDGVGPQQLQRHWLAFASCPTCKSSWERLCETAWWTTWDLDVIQQESYIVIL